MIRSYRKFFDKNTSETETPQEQVPLGSGAHSHENLAFEEEEKHLEPKDTSTDSVASTMDTTLDSTASEGGQETKAVEETRNDSGISVSPVNGSDVTTGEMPTGDVRDNEDKSSVDMRPVLKSISAFAMQFTAARAPEITVDKPKTLFSVAKGDNTDAPSQPPRRHTEHNIGKELLKRSTLTPEMAATRRRHSDYAVSVPMSINEELAIEDLKRRGSNPAKKTGTGRILNFTFFKPLSI